MSQKDKNVIILGATSAIAQATAKIWAKQGTRILLVGRNQNHLDDICRNLLVIGATEAHVAVLDCATAVSQMEFEKLVNVLGGVDIVLLAYGVLGDQRELEENPDLVPGYIQVNFTSLVGWCLAAANKLEEQHAGVLIVIGSVAGDRGRKKNYIYGACKGAMTRLVEGVSHRLAGSGARAVIIKPGFVDTPMTAAFEKKGFLWAKPEDIAKVIIAASLQGAPNIYAPNIWFWIMMIIRHLPTFIFNRLNI